MSEQDRARLYDWLREQAGEQEAEYLMSCIASVPLTDLATKDSVEAVKDSVKRLEKRFDDELPKLATKVSVDRLEKRLGEDRRSSQLRHYWLAGIGLSAAVPMWLSAAGVIG